MKEKEASLQIQHDRTARKKQAERDGWSNSSAFVASRSSFCSFSYLSIGLKIEMWVEERSEQLRCLEECLEEA